MTNQPPFHILSSRRRFLKQASAAGVALAIANWFEVPGAYANALTETPPLTEGPFYPDHLPLDRDNDLVIVGDSTTPALGTITHLSGRIVDTSGSPIRDATVEIWQVDNYGSYINSHGILNGRRDPNFQGYGQFLTDSKGGYRFRTIEPVPYPGRTPHIHVRVKRGDRELLTTQCFIRGYKLNRSDGILNGIWNPKQRQAVLVDFTPISGSVTGEVYAQFDIVLGLTPAA
jgi:protocatechuate 3,4-dioxygenase, beta subunit